MYEKCCQKAGSSTWNPDSWKFMMASDILMSMGSTTASMLKGPMSRSPTAIRLSATTFHSFIHSFIHSIVMQRMQRGSVGSAGPSSNPGSATQGGLSLWANKQLEKRREASANGYEWMYCMIVTMNVWKDKINRKGGSCHQTLRFKGWSLN